MPWMDVLSRDLIEQVGVSSGALQEEELFISAIYQKPIGLNVALSVLVPIAGKEMISVLER